MLGVSKVGLSELYVDPACKWLEARGAEIRTGAVADGFWMDGERVKALALLEGGAFEADAFLLALSPHGMARLAEKEPLSKMEFFSRIKEIAPSPIVSVNLWLDKPLEMDAEFVGILEGPVEWVFNRNSVLGTKAEGRYCYALVTSAAREMLEKHNSQIAEQCIEAIKENFPEARGAKVLHASVVKEPHATFSAPPGFEALRCPQKTPIENLFLAGDWTATGLPATLESAADSAVRATAEILKFFGA